MVSFTFDRVGNNVGKGKNDGYQHCSLFHDVFKTCLFLGYKNLELLICYHQTFFQFVLHVFTKQQKFLTGQNWKH